MSNRNPQRYPEQKEKKYCCFIKKYWIGIILVISAGIVTFIELTNYSLSLFFAIPLILVSAIFTILDKIKEDRGKESIIKLFEDVYNVSIESDVRATLDCDAQIEYRHDRIRLQDMKRIGRPPGHGQLAFFHELVHALLNTMNHELAKDEAFVEIFGQLLRQALVTMEF